MNRKRGLGCANTLFFSLYKFLCVDDEKLKVMISPLTALKFCWRMVTPGVPNMAQVGIAEVKYFTFKTL